MGARRHTYLDELRVGLALLAEVTDGFEDDAALRVGQLVAEREQHLGGLVDLVVDKPPVRVQLPEPLATRQGRREKAQLLQRHGGEEREGLHLVEQHQRHHRVVQQRHIQR